MRRNISRTLLRELLLNFPFCDYLGNLLHTPWTDPLVPLAIGWGSESFLEGEELSDAVTSGAVQFFQTSIHFSLIIIIDLILFSALNG